MAEASLRDFMAGFKTIITAGALSLLAGCSTNPATGQQQFTALMSPAQEMKIGADEHAKIMKTYGVPAGTENLQIYISRIGTDLAKNTERADVQYKFFLLDDPMVNAFALPGGYVYITRGLLAQANSEAELAAVLGHEIGHITGRHSAERYSQGMMTSLGATILAAALDSQAATQAVGLGSELFLKSYSRGHENEADTLGIRYLAAAGYDPRGMTGFLTGLEANTALEARIDGRGGQGGVDWFSTHPLTSDRIRNTVATAGQYPQQGEIGRDSYLQMIDGLLYGDSPRHGFVRGTRFYHTDLDFMFEAPEGFRMMNQPEQVVATNGKGAVIIFDAAGNPGNLDPQSYIERGWMKDGSAPSGAERIEINGRPAATAAFEGKVGGRPATVRLVAVEWRPGVMYRFQMAYPPGSGGALVDALKRTTYSLRPLNAAEKQDIKPHRLRIVTAKAGDTVATLAGRMAYDDHRQDRFRVLNGMSAGEEVVAGRIYKIVADR